jgi:hypothetical protein
MHVNIYLWNSACYVTFKDAVEDNDFILTGRYVEKDSEDYKSRIKTIEDAKEILGDDYLNVEEVPFATDKING